MAGRAFAVGGVLAVSGVTHSFLDDHSCSKGLLLGLPCKCHHLLIGLLMGGSESCGRIGLGIFGQLLHLLSHLLLGWPLKPEVALDGSQDLLAKLFCHLLFAPASVGQPA